MAKAKRTCSFMDCAREEIARGWCSVHYGRWRYWGSPDGSDVAGLSHRRSLNSRVQAVDRACNMCGMVYSPTRRDSIYCSSTCNNRALDDSNQACSVEGCHRGVRAKGICNMHYKRVSRAEGRTKPSVWDDRRRENHERRRARMKGVVSEVVHLADVIERSGGMCGICDEPIDLDLRHPNPQSRSLDHIVPLARGGAHSLANCQLAHLRCNISKGARVA